MSKNIVFIANFSKTEVFKRVARVLESYGANVFWIVTNTKIRDDLVECFGLGNVLYIPKDNERDPIIQELRISKINDIVANDRHLKYDLNGGKQYLRSIQFPIERFLIQNGISFVFGEVTWAHEILIYRLCKHPALTGVQFLNPHSIRIPNGRFAFYTDDSMSNIYEAYNSNNTPGYENFLVEKPAYLKRNDAINKSSRSISVIFKKILLFISGHNKDPYDPTILNNRRIVLLMRVKEILNGFLYLKFFVKDLKQPPKGNYVFLPLHKQPESSIDVAGRFYENQSQNIFNIWRTLPDGWKLVIKEHSNAIGDRELGFYKSLQKLPDVYFVDEAVDSEILIRASKFVVTVSGTSALEASLFGIPSLTFADCYFNRFSSCRKISLDDLNNCNTITDLLEEPCLENVKEVKKYVMDYSFKGVIADPISTPTCLDDINISDIAFGIKSVIDGK